MEDQISQEPVNSFENIDFNSSDGNKEITVEQEEEQVPCETPIFLYFSIILIIINYYYFHIWLKFWFMCRVSCSYISPQNLLPNIFVNCISRRIKIILFFFRQRWLIQK